MSNQLQTLVNQFLDFYAANKHREELHQITDFILSHALSARGYNNFRDQEESGELFFIEQILSKSHPKLCFDIGANQGNYSLKLLESTTADVISFEPLPQACEKLQENTKMYGSRIKIENLGIGAENDNLKINYNPNITEHASFSNRISEINYLDNSYEILVSVVSLDSYIFENNIREIDLLKIDVEGFESEVFAGAKQTLKIVRPKFIQLEFNWHQLFHNTSLLHFFNQLDGYELFQLLPNNWIKRDPKDPLSNIFMFSNFVFVRV